jgi:HEAT repeat protein
MSTGRLSQCLVVALAVGSLLALSGHAWADDKPPLKELIAALDSTDDAKYQRAKQSLYKAVTKKDLPALISAANKGNSRVRIGIMSCLSKFRDYPSVEPPGIDLFLVRCLRDKDPIVRSVAASTAEFFAADSTELFAALSKTLDDEEKTRTRYGDPACNSAARSFGFLGRRSPGAARPAYPKLIRMAEKHRDRRTRESAIFALSLLRQGDESQRPLLLDVLIRIARRDPDSKIRVQALAALAYPGERDATVVPWLRRIWKEELGQKGGGDVDVLEAVGLAFYNLGPCSAEAVPDLLPVLKDKKNNVTVRRWCISVLLAVGKPGKAGLPILRAIVEDAEESWAFRNGLEDHIRKLMSQ